MKRTKKTAVVSQDYACCPHPRPVGAMPCPPPTQPFPGVTLGPNSILRDLLEGRMHPNMIRFK